MGTGALLASLIIAVVLIGIGTAVYFLYFAPKDDSGFFSGKGGLSQGGFSGNLTDGAGSSLRGGSSGGVTRTPLTDEQLAENLEKIKAHQKKKKKKIPPPSVEQKFFMAGMFTEQDRKEFARLRIIVPVVLAPILGFLMYTALGVEWLFVGAIFGVLLGFQVPFSILDRRILARNEEIMFFLPLVIEQISIGVSSSLDIGPCVQRVVLMADERDSHNPVTELLKIVNNYVRSGASLDDALSEVGQLAGHVSLKHTFASLAQVSRHGGEITKQLHELADAVSSQRETQIDAKIKKLELAATGPVAMVFMGFLVILLIGFGLQVVSAFN